jgi:multisubunit Na+/H+ antiporter MnhB subunit
VSARTLEGAPTTERGQPVPDSVPEPWALRVFARRHPWWSAWIVLGLISAALVLWARTRPGFDPYGWLTWGQQTITASLDTNAAPSWKPLPYLFTVPFALAGHYQLYLWMFTAVAVSLSGLVFAGLIAHRLTGPAAHPRAALATGVFTALALAGIQDYWHYILSAQSDPMIVALCLGAIYCHLSGRPRWAFVLGALAALGRPEVWPFIGLYGIWMWITLPSTRWLVAGGAVLVLALWFGIPALTSRTPFVAASNAMDSGRALRGNKVFGTIGRFLQLNAWPLEVAALLAVVIAAVRRDKVTLALAAGIVVWVVIETAFALHGWPGLARYMFEAGAVAVVLAGIAVGRLLSDAPALVRAPGWAGLGLVVVLVAGLLPWAVSQARAERKDIREQRLRTREINNLHSVVARLGGAARIRSCGEPLTRLEYQTMLAWTLHLNVAKIGYKYSQSIAHGNPIVLFTPYPTGVGWKVQALHQVSPACKSLP